jgi:hypothetical protein
MVVFAIVITIFNTKGRYNNKVDSTPENANPWLMIAVLLEAVSVMFYLIFSLYLCNVFQTI